MNNEAIFEKARELGELIAQSEVFQNLQAMEEQSSADPEIADLYAEYADLSDQLQSAVMEDMPDSDRIKGLNRDREALGQRLGSHPGMQKANQARVSFNLLMEGVNRQLQVALKPDADFGDEEGCGSGGCEGCQGCGTR